MARPRIGTTGNCGTHMAFVFVTLEVSHSNISLLKLGADRNLPRLCVGTGVLARPRIGPSGKCSSHCGHRIHTRSVPIRDVVVEAGGILKPARLRVSTGALARPPIGTSGKYTTHVPNIVVTLDVSHAEMSMLNVLALKNLPGTGALAHPRFGTRGNCNTHIRSILVTLEVSHTERSLLKLVAELNLPGCMSALEHRHVPALAPAESAALTSIPCPSRSKCPTPRCPG